jgi:hypothetical protein
MTRPIIRVHNTETNEIVDREMNDLEFEQYKKDTIATEARRLEEAKVEAKKVAAEAKLVALGLDLDDLRALGL